jgi:AAA+ superfamily predicted ATPase
MTAAATFDPKIRIADPLAASWLAEVTLRLRREVLWLWHERDSSTGAGKLFAPPLGDPALESLDLTRFAQEKQRLLGSDVTALHLTRQIEVLRRARPESNGPWARMVQRLGLDEAAQLVLAMGVMVCADAACGSIFATCQNDATKTLPTLALAQRLLSDPTALLPLDVGHPLFRFAVLTFHGDDTVVSWQRPFDANLLIVETILRNEGRLPSELQVLSDGAIEVLPTSDVHTAARLFADAPIAPQFVPLLGDGGADAGGWCQQLSRLTGRYIVELPCAVPPQGPRLRALAAWAWLHGVDILLSGLSAPSVDGHRDPLSWPAAPVRWFVAVNELQATRQLPQHLLGPSMQLPSTTFAVRLMRFQRALGPHADSLAPLVKELARRYRFSAATMNAVGAAARAWPGPLDGENLSFLCRSHGRTDLGNLAQTVNPRFTLDELVLPDAETQQIQEIVRAMRALTRVHHEWGTAQAWGEAGLSVLFCGPPGTGKTMAAEAIASELQLPMFRIDLSQVVNKYIGETEKNLRRVFDAAEESDCLMFFDEADALFGKRTSVKDAHDRFANIEVSYLLERMERFKGLAILATNRRKDLDEAFLRRLRYLVEFPLPNVSERERLWRAVFPPAVDTSALDFGALARLFPLAGGHIRSIAFNACLQAASGGRPALDMPRILQALKRELDKLNRPNSPESFAEFRPAVETLFAGAAS